MRSLQKTGLIYEIQFNLYLLNTYASVCTRAENTRAYTLVVMAAVASAAAGWRRCIRRDCERAGARWLHAKYPARAQIIMSRVHARSLVIFGDFNACTRGAGRSMHAPAPACVRACLIGYRVCACSVLVKVARTHATTHRRSAHRDRRPDDLCAHVEEFAYEHPHWVRSENITYWMGGGGGRERRVIYFMWSACHTAYRRHARTHARTPLGNGSLRMHERISHSFVPLLCCGIRHRHATEAHRMPRISSEKANPN